MIVVDLMIKSAYLIFMLINLILELWIIWCIFNKLIPKSDNFLPVLFILIF